MVNILLVDDHPLVRDQLRAVVESEKDLRICGETEDGHHALSVISATKPGLAIVDLTLKRSSGFDLIKEIHQRHPKLPVLVLSMHDEALYAERSLQAGARGYVMKQQETDILLEAIRQVLRGKVYLSERVRDTIVNRIGGNVNEDKSASLAQRLSNRELEVFQLIGDGYATHEIARRLHLSAKTVASHREHIKEKLNLRTGEELARFAIHWLRYRTPDVDATLAPRPTAEKPPKSRPSKAAAR